ncbi:hypothetical protein LCGC14_0258970 [marine sediment metagenome]|uniref:Uncharacterized protein n=1 Tax=marine sediment metagenome TaxID=412755 RepID=A0A0F9UJA9_9ZZZZ
MTNYTAHNSLTSTTIHTADLGAALAHIGSHVHVTRPDGMTAGPMDLNTGRCDQVTMWASLDGQVRHRIATGRVKGTVAGWIKKTN